MSAMSCLHGEGVSFAATAAPSVRSSQASAEFNVSSDAEMCSSLAATKDLNMQRDCKPQLRWYKCRACHRKLAEDHFSAERLATWRNKKYDQILCLQCTPAWETRWWQKRADKQKYTCSACTKQRPRTAYSAEGFADQKAIVCMDCNHFF